MKRFIRVLFLLGLGFCIYKAWSLKQADYQFVDTFDYSINDERLFDQTVLSGIVSVF